MHPPIFTLRDYQQKFADSIIRALAQYKKVIGCAATGSGKTKTFIYLAQRAHAKGLTVLILTEASKIFEQLTAELHAGNIESSKKDSSLLHGHIYIAMAQTLVRRKKMLQSLIAADNRLLVITDEAHIGTPTKLLLQLPNALHIGFTATPDWRVAKHLPLLYNACIVGPQPDELVQSGHLMPYRHFARISADLDALKIHNGEFTEQSQEAAFTSARVYDGLIHDLRTIAYRKAIIFTSSIKHCQAVSEELARAGILNIQIHSQRPDGEQAFDMSRFKDLNSSINVLVSVGILTKGWDYPPLDLVALVRATTSLPLYMQMIGRGSRVYPGKEHFTVLDYGGNYERHGLWDAEVEWDKKWKEQKKKKKEQAAPVKMCPECDYINTAAARVCVNCGYQFPAPPAPDPEETQLIEVTEAYRKLVGRTISSLSPQELAIYARFKNKKAFAIRVARAKYQAGEIHYLPAFASAMNYKPGWAHFQSQSIPTETIEFTDITLR